MENQILLTKISEAKQGSQKAFSYLLNAFWLDVYNFQLKRIGNESDAEDITIQTFAKAFDKISTYDKNYSFKTWLITISKNIHIDMLRNQQVMVSSYSQELETIPIVDDSLTVEDTLIVEQNLNYLLSCIKKLKEPYRTVIQLRYLQEKSYKEISYATNTNLNNVKVTLLRAKKILLDIIKRVE